MVWLQIWLLTGNAKWWCTNLGLLDKWQSRERWRYYVFVVEYPKENSDEVG